MVRPLGGDHPLHFERGLGEVQEESVLLSNGPEIRTSDGEMDVVKRLDRLELNHDQLRHKQVQPVEAHLASAVHDRDRELALERNIPGPRLEATYPDLLPGFLVSS